MQKDKTQVELAIFLERIEYILIKSWRNNGIIEGLFDSVVE